MVQIVSRKGLLIYGRISDVVLQIKSLSKDYKYVRDLIQAKTDLLS